MGGADAFSPIFVGAGSLILILGGGICLFLRPAAGTKQRHAERARAASAKGWRYESSIPGTLLYRVTGSAAGFPWQLATDSGGSDDSASTMWSTDAIRLPDLELMVRSQGPYEQMKGNRDGAALNLSGTIATMVGLPRPQLLDLMRTGIEYRPQRTAVRENFTILSREPCLSQAVMTPEVEDALARWAMCPHLGEQQRRSLAVDLGQTNLRAHCAGILADGEAMALLIEIGTAFSRAYLHAEESGAVSACAVF
jgi:hypothetical protein